MRKDQKGPMCGIWFWKKDLVGYWRVRTGAAWVVQGTVACRAGLQEKWQSWAEKTNLTYFPGCLRPESGLFLQSNTHHPRPHPHLSYSLKTFQRVGQGAPVAQHRCMPCGLTPTVPLQVGLVKAIGKPLNGACSISQTAQMNLGIRKSRYCHTFLRP